MSLLRHIKAVHAWDPSGFLPLLLTGHRVGRVRKDFALRLLDFPAVFARSTDGIEIVPADVGPDGLTAAVGLVVRKLVQAGEIPSWRNEWFDVGADDDRRPLFRIDRGALPRFGVRAYGVHLNGYVRRPDGLHLWIARRAPDKLVDPDKLDNVVAGGMGAGHDPWSTLLKEAEEEASLSKEIAGKAIPVGIVSYAMERENGLRDDVLFLYDLELPADVVPTPNDQEIVGFELLPVGEVLRLVRDTDDVKFNVALTLIDFFVRHGVIGPGDPDYLPICRGLRG